MNSSELSRPESGRPLSNPGYLTAIALVFIALIMVLHEPGSALILQFLEPLGAIRNGYLYEEHRPLEIANKFSLIIAVMAAASLYLRTAIVPVSNVAVAFGLFGVTLYAGESNLIMEGHRPILGAAFGAWLGLALLKQRAWTLIGVLALSAGALATGHFADWCGHHCAEMPALVATFGDFVSGWEEPMEFVGGVLFSLAVLMYWQRWLPAPTTARGRHWLLLAIAAALLIALGNSLQHYKYDAGTQALKLACLLASLGCWLAVLIIRDRQRLPDPARLFLATMLIVMFLVVPTIYGSYSVRTNTVHGLLWLPALVAMARVLLRCAPARLEPIRVAA